MVAVGSAPPTEQKVRHVFRERYAKSELPALLRDIKRGTDRTVCIILSAMIERELEELIILRLTLAVPLSKARRGSLFDRDGPLSTFSGNIKLARALELIDGISERELNAIRRIRNMFAHTALPLTFNSVEIKKELPLIRDARYYSIVFDVVEIERLPKVRRDYVLSCLQILTDLTVSLIVVYEFVQTISDAITDYRERHGILGAKNYQ